MNFKALPEKFKVVDEYLIRGPHPSPVDIFKLKKEGVNQIYDFRHYSLRGFKFIEQFFCRIAGIKYIRRAFSYLDGKYPRLKDYEAVASAVAQNGKNGGKSLFHCNSGTHRTALMSAFYDITKGEGLGAAFKQEGYTERLARVLKEQVTDTRFFSRNRVDITTKNPIKRAKNKFNNRVTEATQKAYYRFIDMLTPKTQVV